MIPKILHLIWMQGIDAMPGDYRRCVKTWGPAHPGWEIQVWDKTSLDWIQNSWVWDIDNPTIQSDVARIEVVHKYGGVYFDADMECRRSLEDVVKECNAFVSMRNLRRVENAGFGAAPGHEWMKQLISRVGDRCTSIRRVLDMDAPFNASVAGRSDLKVFPVMKFHLMDVIQDRPKMKDAYCIHHRLSHWMYDDDRYADDRRQRDLVSA